MEQDAQPQSEQPQPVQGSVTVDVERAEAVLVERYPQLLRFAYLVLPPELGRHRRVLVAHAIVQRSLPRTARTVGASAGAPAAAGPPAVRGRARGGVSGEQELAYASVRLRILRALLAYGRRPGWWPDRLPAPAALRPSLPAVWGLRLFPFAGGADELALERALSVLGTESRAACALARLEGLTYTDVQWVLAEAGAADPAAAQDAADRLPVSGTRDVETLLRSHEFDPYAVQARPTDLLRRRQRTRIGGLALAVVAAGLLAVSFLPTDGPGTGDGSMVALEDGRAPAKGPLDPAGLVRAGAGRWADTSRVDFHAWPARGSRRGDEGLLARALKTWAHPAGARSQAVPGTSTAPPATSPQLLYAGGAGGATVVVLYEGQRIVRYTEPPEGAAPELDFTRTDEADVTTAAAVVLHRAEGRSRYLTAPWISEAGTRDLRDPGGATRPLDRDDEGVTAPVPEPYRGGCGEWPVLELRSSEKIVERHAFLVTDLGDVTPAHLTYTPHPSSGDPARQPREALSAEALRSWEGNACELKSMRGKGVRAVNNWEFAHPKLPGDGGRAEWVCTRADTWRGAGLVSVQFREGTSGRGRIAAEARDTAACSRFGQHVLAGIRWESEKGRWYQLAAGSRQVTGIESTGGVKGSADGTTLALRTGKDAAPAELTARLKEGGPLRALR